MHDKRGGVCMSWRSQDSYAESVLSSTFSCVPGNKLGYHVAPQAPLPTHIGSAVQGPPLFFCHRNLFPPKLHIVTVAQLPLSALNTFAENQLSTDKSVSEYFIFSHGSVCLYSRTVLSWELQFIVYAF